MKRICALIAVMWVAFSVLPSPASAQSEKQGIAILKEAQEIWNTRRTKEDKEKALATYQQALAIFTQVKSDKWEGETLTRMILVYHSLSQYQKALECGGKALDIHRKVGNRQMEGVTLTRMGLVYERLGQYQNSLDYGEKALDIHRKVGNLRMEAVTLSNMGLVYERLGQYQKALECLERALPIQEKMSDADGAGFSLHRIGLVRLELGQYRKALQYYSKAFDVRKKAGNVDGQGTTLENIGMVYYNLGQYQSALDSYEKALDIHRKIGNRQMEGAILNDIGAVYSNLGQYQKASEYYETALDICRQIGDLGSEANSWALMGRLYQSWGQRQKAMECHERGLEIRRRIGNQNGESNSLTHVGRVYFGFAQYDDALRNFHNALNIKKKIGTPTGQVRAMIAWTYMEQGELDKAEEFIKDTDSKWVLGKLHLLRLEYGKAQRDYDALLAWAEKSGNVESLFAAYTGLGKVSEGLEDYKKAEEYYEKGMKLSEEMRSSLLPSERKNFFEVKVQGFERSEPAKGLTRVRMKLNRAAESIDSSEVTRARAFSDGIALRSERGVAGVPGDILEKERDLVSKGAALKTERGKVAKDKNPERYSNLTEEVKTAEAELNSFVEMLRNKHTAYAAVKYPRPVTLKESSLGQDEHVVMFDVSAEGVGIKLIKGKTIAETYYKKWGLDELEKEIQRFRQPFEQADLRKFDPELAESLYKGLLARVLMEVPKGTPLVIIPDGILAVLPFEALVIGGKATWQKGQWGDYPAGLTYLGDVYPISYYQSITALTLARTAREKRQPGDRLLVIADPVFLMQDARVQGAKQTQVAKAGGEFYIKLMAAIEEQGEGGFRFDRLPQTGALAEDLRKLYGDKVDVYTGLKADKANFLAEVAPNLHRYGQILFATHGVFASHIPGIQEPFLAMSMVPPGTDGFLKMSDVMSLKMNADLVALTACQTGLGKDLSGEGVMSMGRAFQYAGAKSILMSLWSVAEETSTMLAETFFKHLKEGKNKLEALKMAREEVRKEGADHPFFWAAFVLVGEVN